ncbi:hypothetical protein MKQ70_32150 [Chitinophaga sedimenti]|uniref:hypothetical protein n=1 Tax=Chitinophaga sedimenti TaxID=2033606 RepID=UPI00200546BF|nr:hypothetical protein [Chitinophaga sedimenti]MCK7559371.1 hypothetical protein [Chitinophaga sedimenti]
MLLTLLCYGCRKDSLNQENDTGARVSLKTVQAAFSTVSPVIPTKEDAAPTTYYNIPDWKSSSWENRDKGASFWKIPLKSAANGYRVLQLTEPYTGKKIVVELPAPYLIAHRDSVNGIVFSVVQDVPYTDTSSYELPTNRNNFTGEVNVYDWSEI